VELIERSYFKTEARDNGSLVIQEIGATVDHGDDSDIIDFVVTYLTDLTVLSAGPPPVTMQSLLAGGQMTWTSDGVVVLILQDLDDDPLKQIVMRTFLTLAMISGRFRPDQATQQHIFADRDTGALAAIDGGLVVPADWWQALDGEAPWDAVPFLPASGEPWQPEDFLEWVALVSP